MDKVRVIERSLACRTLGWWALVPLVGVGPALRAIWLYHQVCAEAGEEWNPAERETRLGRALAGISLLLHAAALTLGAVLWLGQV